MTTPLDNTVYQVVPADAGDGSGDVIVPLPDELMTQLGWKEGDTVRTQEIARGTLRLSKIEQPGLPAEGDSNTG